jgi:hypothetical protein
MGTALHRWAGTGAALLAMSVACAVRGQAGQRAGQQAAGPAATAPAGASAATGASHDPAALIAQLSSDNWAQRNAAQTALIAMGQAARKPLEDFLKTKPDEDLRARVEAALQKIDTNKSSGPSLITLHLTDRPVSEAIDALGQQAEAQLVLNDAPPAPAGDRHASIDLDRVPFWEAMKVLADRGGVWPDGVWDWSGNSQSGLVSTGTSFFDKPNAITGPLIILANTATIRSQMAYGRTTVSSGSFILELYVVAEPKIHVTEVTNTDWLKECVDENGKSLMVPEQQTAMRGFGGGRGGGFGRGGNRPVPVSGQTLNAILNCGSDTGRKIAHLRGELHVGVTEKMTIPNLVNAKGVSKTIGSYTVEVKDVALKGSQYQISLTLKGQNLQIDEIKSLLGTLHIGDAQGQGLAAQATGDLFPDRVELVISLAPGVAGRPPTMPNELDWTLPAQTGELVQKFDLQDLPLP